jgi:hypothetical protein
MKNTTVTDFETRLLGTKKILFDPVTHMMQRVLPSLEFSWDSSRLISWLVGSLVAPCVKGCFNKFRRKEIQLSSVDSVHTHSGLYFMCHIIRASWRT